MGPDKPNEDDTPIARAIVQVVQIALNRQSNPDSRLKYLCDKAEAHLAQDFAAERATKHHAAGLNASQAYGCVSDHVAVQSFIL